MMRARIATMCIRHLLQRTRRPILSFEKRWVAVMSEIWNTKYGKRRVRHEPATLDDAVFAAQGLTDDLEGQIEIASSLIDLPRDVVKAALVKRAPIRLDKARIATTSANGQTRAVVVERRPARRIAPGTPLRFRLG